MINYRWAIDSIVTKNTTDKENIVVYVSYQILGEDGEFSSIKRGVAPLTDVKEGDDFILFTELTEDIVVTWVKNILGVEEIAKLEKELLNEVEAQKKPNDAIVLQSVELPWK